MSNKIESLKAKQEELARQQAELEKEINEIRLAEKKGVIEKIVAQCNEFGITSKDLAAALSKTKKKKGPAKAFLPKFQNEDGSKTWNGIGPKPAWLKDLMASTGKDADAFKIKGA